MKIKTLLKTFISSHMHPNISRAFDKAKSFLLKLTKHTHLVDIPIPLKRKNKNNNKKKPKKLFFGSFRLHYNWCSSHVMPLGQETYCNSTSHVYYDSNWNSVIPTSFDCYCYHDHRMQVSDANDDDDDHELSKNLKWLEEKGNNDNNDHECYNSSCNENIDKLADLFIADCHEKFRLEKQESYRRFQEMMARSV